MSLPLPPSISTTTNPKDFLLSESNSTSFDETDYETVASENESRNSSSRSLLQKSSSSLDGDRSRLNSRDNMEDGKEEQDENDDPLQALEKAMNVVDKELDMFAEEEEVSSLRRLLTWIDQNRG